MSNKKHGNHRLTQKQEEFCQHIFSGKSQRESYMLAYASSKKWGINSIDVAASQLLDNDLVQARLKELRNKDVKKVMWTRQKALETINKAMEMHQQDMERIEKAYQEDLDRKDMELKQWVQLLNVENADTKRIQKHINQLLDEMSDLRKVRRINAVNTHGIYEGAKILNRMFGYDITKVEIKQEDIEKDNIKQLSVEELKELAYANRPRNEGENTEES